MPQAPTEKAPHLAEIDAFYGERVTAADRGASSTRLLSPDYWTAGLPTALLGTSFGCGNPLAVCDVQSGDTVLDLGCGAGLDLILAAEKTGPSGQVIGLDMNPEMIARARANAAAHGHANVTVLNGTIEAIPLPDRSVDRVVSNCVINLSLDKPAAFAEIHRVLRPGGTMLISDIVAEDLPDWVGQHADLYAACLSAAVSEAKYHRLAADAGLLDVSTVDALIYDTGALRQLIEDELPIAVEALAAQMGLSRRAMLDKTVADLSGKFKSIKVAGRTAA